MRAIDEGLGQIDFAAVAKVFGERFQDLVEHALLDPFLHAAMTGLARRELARQCLPRCTGPQDPEHAIEDAPSWNSRTAFTVLAALGFRDQSLDSTPLLVGERHVLLDHASDRTASSWRTNLKNRSKSRYLRTGFSRCVLVAGRVWHPTQELKRITGERIRLSFICTNLIPVVSWILQWGPHAKVIEPTDLATMIVDELEGARALYQAR